MKKKTKKKVSFKENMESKMLQMKEAKMEKTKGSKKGGKAKKAWK